MPPTPKQPPPTEPGFLVNGTYYPMPQGGFTLGEARAIRRITGLTMQAFEAHLQEAQRTGDFSDPDVVAAFVYVAMHRADPHTTIEVVDGLVLEQIEPVGEEDAATAAADPTTPPAPTTPPSGTAA